MAIRYVETCLRVNLLIRASLSQTPHCPRPQMNFVQKMTSDWGV